MQCSIGSFHKQVYDRNKVESPELKQMVKKLLSIISRVARLVEIIVSFISQLSSSAQL